MQKSHTKVLLLFFFRSHDRAADSPIRTLFFADDIDRSIAEVRCDIRAPHCPMRRPICLGFLEAFRTFCLVPPAELRGLMNEISRTSHAVGHSTGRAKTGEIASVFEVLLGEKTGRAKVDIVILCRDDNLPLELRLLRRKCRFQESRIS